MRFLVIGLGSMGKRRIRCLLELGVSKEDIYGDDKNPSRKAEAEELYGINIYYPYKFLEMKDLVFIICTPPDKHLEYMKKANDLKIPCFVEASVCIESLEELKDSKWIYPSATMRCCKDVIELKKELQQIECTKFEYRCVSWLPDWHPNEDISNFYVSKKETGACREMVPFELEWLIWIFGDVKQIKGIVGNTGMFGEIDDHYHMLIEFTSGVIGYVLIDVISKDAGEGYRQLRYSKKGDQRYEYIFRGDEQMYVEEMRHFIESVNGNETYHYSLKEDIEVLKLLNEVEKNGKL